MWEIYEHRRVERQLNRLPQNILQRYEIWKEILSVSGPQGLRRIRGFKDEALRGDWKGHRSSRLSQQHRVIYRVERDLVRVEVVSVNPHDYRRR
jgi:addiction module RelE/StbE family toxin